MAITRLNNNSITSITALPSGCTSASGLNLNAPFAMLSRYGMSCFTDNTYVKVPLVSGDIEFSSGTIWDSTNNRLNPNVAGKYLVYAKGHKDEGYTCNDLKLAIYKNGSIVYGSDNSALAVSNADDTGTAEYVSVQVLVDMNGTSDYIESYLFQNSGSSRNLYYHNLHMFKIG